MANPIWIRCESNTQLFDRESNKLPLPHESNKDTICKSFNIIFFSIRKFINVQINTQNLSSKFINVQINTQNLSSYRVL